MASRGDKIRYAIFWSYLVLSLAALLRIIYEFFDRATILMYRPVDMEQGTAPTGIIEEISQHLNTQMEYLILFGVSVLINIVIALVLFVATHKTFKGTRKT